MYILGINAYHGGASACLIRDGQLIAAAEEERFRRIKYWAGFPVEAIRYVLEEGKISPCDLDHIGVSRDPSAISGTSRKAAATVIMAVAAKERLPWTRCKIRA